MCIRLKGAFAICIISCLTLGAAASDGDGDSGESFLSDLPVEMHGFYEARGGMRTQEDRNETDMSIMEGRFQLDLYSYLDWGDVRFKGDVYGDFVTERGYFDMREANVFLRPLDYMDLKTGRQILTWGTGDLLFINDLFPKDWQSFFIGRDVEYLKAPSDAAKVSLFGDFANLDVVYTPRFDHDRFISGERISYWNSNLGRLAGRDAIVHTEKPNEWFEDDEIATRLYKNIDNYELAFYGYRGFWKSPGGQTPARTQATFPDLNVYGTSLRGTVGKGIGNVEFGYYESADDQSGTSALVNNSEMRYLIGYSQEIARNLTMGLQYYVEQMLDYDQYRTSLGSGPFRDEYRHVVTLRLTKLLMNQNLRCSLFTYYSPSDADVYARPNINYKVSDNLSVETGANLFYGDHEHTFFGQFQNNNNIYAGMRYSF